MLTNFDPMNPPSVIHGWKAMDLLFLMVKRKKYFLNPISRQNFAYAFAETPNLNLEVCLTWYLTKMQQLGSMDNFYWVDDMAVHSY